MIDVHVCWNDCQGNLDMLVAVEFTRDCEFCSLGTDPIDGDNIRYRPKEFFHRVNKEWHRFRFEENFSHVGNVCWDMLRMTDQDAAKFFLHLQGLRHWTLEVARQEIFDKWGSVTAEEFLALAKSI